MRRELYSGNHLCWIDLSHPNADDLALIQKEFNLHPILVQDCLDPNHLPKYEKIGSLQFLIVRIYDFESHDNADTVQGLTRKVAIFVGTGFIITIHRVDPDQFQELVSPCLVEMLEKVETNNGSDHISKDKVPSLIIKFLNRGLRGFHLPLEKSERQIDEFESRLFAVESVQSTLQHLHIQRRRLSLIRRILLHTQDMVQRFAPAGDSSGPLVQDLKENLVTYHFLTDELLEDVNSLLNLHISLSSQKTNEVMRVLTLFSAFFMPLTFIVGVYGMNFKNFPEIEHPHGYFIIWGVMISITIFIGFWFYKKGWLRSGG